jgi:anti-anti-sigma factor
MPPDDPAPFRVDVSREADTAHLRVAGELDIAGTSILQAEIAASRETGSRSLVLDLAGLGFIDSTGLRCILDLDAESRLDGFSIALIQGPPAVRRVFELTNTDTLLRFIQP